MAWTILRSAPTHMKIEPRQHSIPHLRGTANDSASRFSSMPFATLQTQNAFLQHRVQDGGAVHRIRYGHSVATRIRCNVKDLRFEARGWCFFPLGRA